MSAGSRRFWFCIRRIRCFPPAAVPQPEFLPEACRSRYASSSQKARLPPQRFCSTASLLSFPQDAHEQGINAASFSCAELLATGGTDRLVKLWDIKAGLLLTLVLLIVSTTP